MSLIEQLRAEHEAQRQRRRASERDATTTIGGETVALGAPETYQAADETFLGASNLQGVPRGREAIEARQIAETAPFQMILNAVNDQLLGGEFAFPSADGDEDQAEADLKGVAADVFAGPHHAGADKDDLVAAWTTDMATVGNAYAEPLRPDGDSDLPMAAFKAVDALTIRHNITEGGAFGDPAFYQAPVRGASGLFTEVSRSDVTALAREDLIVMQWPGAERSHRVYPLPPALQLKEWLELIADSTTHLSRYYSDSETPTGILSARDANPNGVDTIKEELEAAKGDPRSAPVITEDARWIEIGGSAVDLSHVEEQQWFLQLCMAAFGVPKTELGMDDQVNFATSESELQVVAKRLTSKLSRTIAQALERQALPQFEAYQQLGQPFGVELRHSDPREERLDEQQAIEKWNNDALTYREYREAIGADATDEDTTVTMNGETIDYGDQPKSVVESLLISVRTERGDDAAGDGGGDAPE